MSAPRRTTTHVGADELTDMIHVAAQVSDYLIQHGTPSEQVMGKLLDDAARALSTTRRTVQVISPPPLVVNVSKAVNPDD